MRKSDLTHDRPTDVIPGNDCICKRGGRGYLEGPGNLQELIVRHCSPTLAGLKCGNLFRVSSDAHGLSDTVAGIESGLLDKGIRIRILRTAVGDSLVYVYRPDQVEARLEEDAVRMFLQNEGYDVDDPGSLVDELERRFVYGIPHEIGVFLGYPIDDVLGYIAHEGKDYVCLGCWKAYSDPEGARRMFRILKICRRMCEDCHSRGIPLERLAVRTSCQASAASFCSTRPCGLRGSC